MPPRDPKTGDRLRQLAWSRIVPLLFGLAVLAFLTAIERQQWFHIKPATGTARAMSFAAEEPERTES